MSSVRNTIFILIHRLKKIQQMYSVGERYNLTLLVQQSSQLTSFVKEIHL